MSVLNKIFKSYSEKEVKRVKPIVNKINGLEEEMTKLTDNELRAKTEYFKGQLKEGKTLDSLQNIIRQITLKEFGEKYRVTVDVENYKEHRITNIERTARKIAREVARTKVEAKLDSMNSYERRIIHNVLANHKYVYTESTGEEPNRAVVIKPKED